MSQLLIEGVNPNYLEHYGVIGMKWGVRKDRSKATAKAYKKLAKLDRKASTSSAKAEMYKTKAEARRSQAQVYRDRYELRGRTRDLKRASKWSTKAQASGQEAYRLQKKASKSTIKAQKWVKAMNKYLGETKMSELDSEQISLGKRYALDLIDDRKTKKR